MRRLALILCSLAIPFLLAAIGLRLMTSRPYLQLVYARPGFPAAPGFEDEARMALAWPSTRFIVSRAPARELAALEHEGRPLYEPGEIQHLLDVRRVVDRLEALALAGLTCLLLTGLAARRGSWPAAWLRAISRGGWLTLVAIGLLVPAIGLAFQLAFTLFHQLLFEPGTWQFSADSGLIRLFPEQFWYDSALAAAAYLLVTSLATAIGAGRLARRLER